MRNHKFEEFAAKYLGWSVDEVVACYSENACTYAHWDRPAIAYLWAGWLGALGFDVPPED